MRGSWVAVSRQLEPVLHLLLIAQLDTHTALPANDHSAQKISTDKAWVVQGVLQDSHPRVSVARQNAGDSSGPTALLLMKEERKKQRLSVCTPTPG